MRAAWLVVIAAVAAGLFLRLKDLERFRLSPDDGNALFSARLHLIEPAREAGFTPLRWLEEDRYWIREMAEGFREPSAETWQHGYLHQWMMRQLRRAGASHTAAVRLDIAILGALTPLVLFLGWRRIFPARPWPGAFAAVLLAFSSLHAWTSRTGWGHAGCTFFLVAWFFVAYRLFARTDARDGKALALRGVSLAIWSLLAFGYHEMASVYVACMGLVALALPLVQRSAGAWRRTAVFVASAAPVGLMTLGLMFNPWAREIYFDPDPAVVAPESAAAAAAATEDEEAAESPVGDWLDYRLQSLELMVVGYGLPQQISIPVLALALLGMFAAARRDRFHFAFTFTNLALPAAVLFLYYNLPYNVRIYLPSIVLLVLFAGEGAAWIWSAARGAVARTAAALAGAALLAFLAATTWVCLYGPLDHPLLVTGFYGPKGKRMREAFDTERPVVDYLRANLAAGESVAATTVKETWFILDDEGIPVHFETFRAPPDEWPKYLFAAASALKKTQYGRVAVCYAPIVKEGAGRLALYRKDEAKVERVKELERRFQQGQPRKGG